MAAEDILEGVDDFIIRSRDSIACRFEGIPLETNTAVQGSPDVGELIGVRLICSLEILLI